MADEFKYMEYVFTKPSLTNDLKPREHKEIQDRLQRKIEKAKALGDIDRMYVAYYNHGVFEIHFTIKGQNRIWVMLLDSNYMDVCPYGNWDTWENIGIINLQKLESSTTTENYGCCCLAKNRMVREMKEEIKLLSEALKDHLS